MSEEAFLSVGIDIGTTTTHLTASRLEMANISSYRQAPRMQISKKEIVFAGPVHFTPLLPDGTIDADAVAELVRQDYARASLSPDSIRAGAVIVTGESAKRRNAKQVAEALADYAGEFVVATAGANQESVLAARGTGAFTASRGHAHRIVNADIGGGTVNVAVISQGELIDTSCLELGGRFLQVLQDGTVTHMTDSAHALLATQSVHVHDKVDAASLWQYGKMAADCIMDFLTGNKSVPESMVISRPGVFLESIDQLWLSGGVAELFASPVDEQYLAGNIPYGDMGLILATCLRRELERKNQPYVVAAGAIRATVIGAGMHALQLSGSTVEVCEDHLPIRNLSLLRLRVENTESDVAMMKAKLQFQIDRTDTEWSKQPIGVYLETESALGYQRLKQLSMDLSELLHHFGATQPYIFVVQHDVAAALGMLLRKQLLGCQLIVIDGIEPEDGDYIDIGKPLVHSQLGASAAALPVVIKSLVFSR